MAQIVLTYKREQRPVAEQLADTLHGAGLSTWHDALIESGQDFKDEITRNIDDASAVLALWSKSAATSREVQWEALRGELQDKLVNARLGPCVIPPLVQGAPTHDLSDWLLTRSADDVAALLGELQGLIEAAKERGASAIGPDVYIAYQHLDRDKARTIAQHLEVAGYLVWWDDRIMPGADWEREILRQFDTAKCVLMLASQTSMQSRWMIDYRDRARARGVLVIARIEPLAVTDMPLGFRGLHTIDLSELAKGPSDLRLRELFRAIDRLVVRNPKSIVKPAAPPLVQKSQAPPVDRPGYDAFVSYKREERSRVQPFVDKLARSGLKVWWDVMIPVGAKWGRAIEDALGSSRSVVVFWTPGSVKSEEVYSEAEYGMSIGMLFPIMLEECEVPIRMRRVQWIGMSKPEAEFDAFAAHLQSKVWASAS